MPDNLLYYGDNLHVLRDHIADEAVDLVYLDPPFNSQANYNILFEEPTGSASEAQITAFEDTWHWTEDAERTYQEIVAGATPEVVEMMSAFRRFIGLNDMMAYLTMMCIRLIELKRVLKATGSIFLHCDPTASHYLKILMDVIFGKKNFKNEIVWHYRKWPSGNRQFQRNHDTILFYAKSTSSERCFNRIDLMPRTESTLKRFGKLKIVSGHDPSGKRVPSQMIDEESPGVPRDDVWDIGRVPPIKQLFPTQKPEALLSRIIRAGSREGDIVLDPFCGCGTTIVEAHKLKRSWIGIDLTHLAINLIKWRLRDIYRLQAKTGYRVIGEPEDRAGALELANQNRYQFQWWALSLIGARPKGDKKKGRDLGIDGYVFFSDEPEKVKRAIVSVKSGKVSVKDIRDLGHVIEREQSEIGIFITLEAPTRDMRTEAIAKGSYRSSTWNKDFSRIQILTIQDILSGDRPVIPQTMPSHKRAKKEETSQQYDLSDVDADE